MAIDVKEIKTKIEETVQKLPEEETKLHTEAKNILSAIENVESHMINWTHVEEWLVKVKAAIEGK